MSLSVAEVYLLLFRKSLVPVLGEAVPIPFDGQIELDGWTWNLEYDENDDAKQGADKGKSAKPAAKPKSSSADAGIVRKIETIHNDAWLTQAQKNKLVLDRLRDSQKEREKTADKEAAAEDDKADGNGKKQLTFKFQKGLDLATTQMLNSMKSGELMPRAVLTLFHRSANAPLTLVITFKNVMLTEYSLEVDVSETMSDLKESWTAQFEQVDYVYQNRPGAGGANAVTQGTARVFKMKLKSLF